MYVRACVCFSFFISRLGYHGPFRCVCVCVVCIVVHVSLVFVVFIVVVGGGGVILGVVVVVVGVVLVLSLMYLTICRCYSDGVVMNERHPCCFIWRKQNS